jgi:hypothetical protein
MTRTRRQTDIGVYPGTSCLAVWTFVESRVGKFLPQSQRGRRRSAQGFNPISANLMRGHSMGEWLLSRRDGAILAWHGVPGKRPHHRAFRARLRLVLSYGTRFRRRRPPRLAGPDHTVPYGTDLSGHSSQALRARLRSGCPYGTKIHSPRRGFD